MNNQSISKDEEDDSGKNSGIDASQGRAGIFSRKSSAKQRKSLKIEVKLNQPIVVVNQQSFNIQLFATKSGQRDPPQMNLNSDSLPSPHKSPAKIINASNYCTAQPTPSASMSTPGSRFSKFRPNAAAMANAMQNGLGES